MELKFLGRGAAFNPKERNTSAFFIENKQLFLIDCGESVFEKLVLNELLCDIDCVNLMITHTHSDHIGSLGTLVMYSYYMLGKPVNIVVKEDEKYINDIKKVIAGFGITNEMYAFIDEKMLDNKYNSFSSIRYIDTKHYDGLNCYSIIMNTVAGLIYYSGDTREMTQMNTVIQSGQEIEKLYVDVTSADFSGNPHLFIGDLNKLIPNEMREKVSCMHFNNDDCINLARNYGFQVVEVYSKENRNGKAK